MHDVDKTPAPRVGAPLWQPSAPARIVVAEDNLDMRALLMARLLDDGHEVYGASSARELVHLLAEGGCTIPPFDGADLIVLDQALPGLSGIEIIRRMRSANSKIPLLLMTAFPTSELLGETRRYRVPFLIKPFSLTDLSNAALLLMIMRVSHRDAPRPCAIF